MSFFAGSEGGGRWRTGVLVAGVGAFGVLAVSGCGAVVHKGADGAGSSAGCDTKAPLYKALPKSVTQRGCTVTVSSSGTYPPMNSFAADGKTIVGFQPDLAKALEKQLGIRITYVVANFDAVLGGISSGRYDTAMMTMTDNPERRKQVNFVDYGKAGSSIAVKAGNPKKVAGMDGLCGLNVATVSGYVQVDQLKAQSDTCTKQGKAKITTMRFPQQTGADQAVATGRAEAELGDTVNVVYSVNRAKGTLKMLPAQVAAAPFGMPFRKDHTDLAKAFQQAFAKILDDGTYAAAAKKYGLTLVTPKKITVNDGHGF